MNSENNTNMDIDFNGTTPADQYADAVAASLPQFYCRTTAYKQWLSSVVKGRGKTIFDAACGNGYVAPLDKSEKVFGIKKVNLCTS